MSAELSVEEITVEYGDGDTSIRPLDQFSLCAPPGAITLLLGPSGSGKTTLLSVLGGLLTPSAGSVRFGDITVTDLSRSDLVRFRRECVGFVFQSFNLIPSLTARENIAAPLLATGLRRREAFFAADRAIEQVALDHRAGHRPQQLSGGERQRVAIARALVAEPALLLADEPTANLDQHQTHEILTLFTELRDAGRCILISSHDPRALAAQDQVVAMGEISPASPPTNDLSSFRPESPRRL